MTPTDKDASYTVHQMGVLRLFVVRTGALTVLLIVGSLIGGIVPARAIAFGMV